MKKEKSYGQPRYFGFNENRKEHGLLSECADCIKKYGGCETPLYSGRGIISFWCAEKEQKLKYKYEIRSNDPGRED